MAKMLKMMGKIKKAKRYESLSKSTSETINSMFWSEEKKIYSDFDMVTGKIANRPVYISDLSPLWYLERPKLDINLGMFTSLLLDYPSGVPSSQQTTGQQWDFPNVWPPYQYLSIKGMENLFHFTNNSTYLRWAESIASRFLMTSWCGFRRYNKQIFEKYHANIVGIPGGGGEYIVQEGFGWTNGVLLWIIKTYHQNITLGDCPSSLIDDGKDEKNEKEEKDLKLDKTKNEIPEIPPFIPVFKDYYSVEVDRCMKRLEFLDWFKRIPHWKLLIVSVMFSILLWTIIAICLDDHDITIGWMDENMITTTIITH